MLQSKLSQRGAKTPFSLSGRRHMWMNQLACIAYVLNKCHFLFLRAKCVTCDVSNCSEGQVLYPLAEHPQWNTFLWAKAIGVYCVVYAGLENSFPGIKERTKYCSKCREVCLEESVEIIYFHFRRWFFFFLWSVCVSLWLICHRKKKVVNVSCGPLKNDYTWISSDSQLYLTSGLANLRHQRTRLKLCMIKIRFKLSDCWWMYFGWLYRFSNFWDYHISL